MIEREGRGTTKRRMRRERERQMDRKSEIALESDVGGIKRCEFFFALGSFTCQVSVIRIKTETKGDIKGPFGYS